MSSPVGGSESLLVLIGAATVAYFVARNVFGHDPYEPPSAPTSIPLIGHAVGLSRSSFNYYTELK